MQCAHTHQRLILVQLQVLKNLAAVAEASGADKSTIVKCNSASCLDPNENSVMPMTIAVYLKDMNDFSAVNKVYGLHREIAEGNERADALAIQASSLLRTSRRGHASRWRAYRWMCWSRLRGSPSSRLETEHGQSFCPALCIDVVLML
jgi:enamine deaminase RidA (YjgF/YER057c/UK114 family)